MSEHSWEETKAILDDPHVSADTKQAVLASYRLNGDYDPDSSEQSQYYEQYNVDDQWYSGLEGYDSDEDPYEKARQESEEGGYQDQQVQDRLDGNQSELDNAQAPSGSGSGGVATSDELLDLAKDALQTFETFIPIDGEAPGDSKHIDGPLDYASSIQEPFDEQRGINFQKFMDEAQRLRDAHSTLSELHSTTESSLNSLYKDWTGDAANASYQKYSEDIAPNAQDLLDHLEGSAQLIERTVETVFRLVKNKADEILKLYTPVVGAATPDMASKVMTLARGEFDSQDQVLEVAAWVDAECGTNIESTIRADDCGLNDENKEMVIRECKTWIRDSWNPDLYENLYATFKSVCEDTKEQVDSAWENLNTYLKEYESEFPEDSGQPQPQPQPDPGGDTPGGGTPGGGTPGGGTPGGGSPGGGSPGGGSPGGGSPGGGSPSTPEVETPEVETPELGTPGADEGQDDGDGEGDESGDDRDSLLGDEKQEDTLTVEQGDNKLEMTEPNEDGEMGITVDDGTGEPKDYNLDFSDEEEGEAGDDDGEFGPQGSGEDKVYRPGPDGKIHIEDGDLKITAEQPDGPDGPTVVTVDDGTGEPTTYTLGNEDGDGSGDGAQRIETKDYEGRLGAAVGGAAGTAASGVESAGAGGAGGGAADIGGGAGGTGSGGGGGEQAESLGAGSQSGASMNAPAGAGVGAAPGGMGGEAMSAASGQGGGNDGGGRGGMMGGGMMGGMGGAGGQGGGDEGRTSNYRIDGQLFEGAESGVRISGTLGDDSDVSVRFDR